MKEYFKDAVVYYFKWLAGEGYNDPVRVIISDFLDAIKVTKEQDDYIKKTANINKNDIDNLLILIKKMKMDNKIDTESLNLIEDYLKRL